jgi:archaellum component FlaC
MEPMPAEWSDKRLDDLNAHVASGFDRVDSDIRALRVETRSELVALRGEMKTGFDRIDERFERVDKRFEHVDKRFERVDDRFDRIDERFERIDERFDALHRLLVQSAGVLLAALVGLHFV